MSLFINDIGGVLINSNYIVFADDLQIHRDCLPSNFNSETEVIENYIKAVFRYSNINQLKLNLDKTKILILGSPVFVNEINFGSLPVV